MHFSESFQGKSAFYESYLNGTRKWTIFYILIVDFLMIVAGFADELKKARKLGTLKQYIVGRSSSTTFADTFEKQEAVLRCLGAFDPNGEVGFLCAYMQFLWVNFVWFKATSLMICIMSSSCSCYKNMTFSYQYLHCRSFFMRTFIYCIWVCVLIKVLDFLIVESPSQSKTRSRKAMQLHNSGSREYPCKVYMGQRSTKENREVKGGRKTNAEEHG